MDFWTALQIWPSVQMRLPLLHTRRMDWQIQTTVVKPLSGLVQGDN